MYNSIFDLIGFCTEDVSSHIIGRFYDEPLDLVLEEYIFKDCFRKIDSPIGCSFSRNIIILDLREPRVRQAKYESYI